MFEGLFQPMHLLLVLGIALLVFGPKRLPELGKGLGTSIRDFKDALSGGGKGEDKTQQAQLAAPVQTAQVAVPAAAPVAVQTAPPATLQTPQTAPAQQPPQSAVQG
jgi:sec-independent protein translocase protein TatA